MIPKDSCVMRTFLGRRHGVHLATVGVDNVNDGDNDHTNDVNDHDGERTNTRRPLLLSSALQFQAATTAAATFVLLYKITSL